MSSSTSKLGLVELADSESFSNAVLNGNWEKVEGLAVDFFGGTSLSDLNNATPTDKKRMLAWTYPNTASNKPSSSGGEIVSYGYSGYFTQVAFTNSTSGAQIFTRSYGANGFTDWKKLGFNDNMQSGTLANNTDLDTVKTVGNWLLSSNNTYTNKPRAGANLLAVIRPSDSGNTVLQVAYGTTKLYTRFATSASNWSEWMSMDNQGEGWIAGCDLNDIRRGGTYGINEANTYLNLPTGVNGGILEVICPSTSETYVIQRLIAGSSAFYMRYRVNSSGTGWTNWYKYTGTLA